MPDASEQMPLPLPLSPQPAATDAHAAESPSSISREALNLLPIRSYQGPVDLLDSDEAVERAIPVIGAESLLGFDTETKPVFRPGVSHPPALVQLAGASRAWIFQLRNLRRLEGMLAILSDRRITKAGIALADDLKKLREVHTFEPAGFTEVGDLARKLGMTQTGLRTLAGLVLGFRVSKREQRSNWARSELSPSQITYAATDAWVSRELYLALQQRLGAKA
jgi:ribonuclease D